MAVLELDKEQILHLALQLKPEEQKEIAQKLFIKEPSENKTTKPEYKPRRVRGKAKDYPLYMSDDFDAPLEDMKEYME